MLGYIDSLLHVFFLHFCNFGEIEADYRRTLRFRIKSKVGKIRSDIALLEANGISVTENCNGVTEFCNGREIEKAQKQTDFGKEWWAEPDLNRRPLARKANVLTKLDDRPASVPSD
jgi:hypothetical protein